MECLQSPWMWTSNQERWLLTEVPCKPLKINNISRGTMEAIASEEKRGRTRYQSLPRQKPPRIQTPWRKEETLKMASRCKELMSNSTLPMDWGTVRFPMNDALSHKGLHSLYPSPVNHKQARYRNLGTLKNGDLDSKHWVQKMHFGHDILEVTLEASSLKWDKGAISLIKSTLESMSQTKLRPWQLNPQIYIGHGNLDLFPL